MLNREQALKVYDGLKHGFRKVTSRMQFDRKRDEFEDPDICTFVIGYDLPDSFKNNVSMYDSVDENTKKIIQPQIDKCLKLIDEMTESVGQVVLILSSNWCGAKRHFKHLHTLLQNDPQRCITLSFPIPLYVNENDETYHKFYWHCQDNLYPKITYTSHVRMEKLSVEYIAQEIPKNSLCSLTFDSSRMPHYIDNTDHLYLWVVCDAVKFKGETLHKGLTVNLHGAI